MNGVLWISHVYRLLLERAVSDVQCEMQVLSFGAASIRKDLIRMSNVQALEVPPHMIEANISLRMIVRAHAGGRVVLCNFNA